MSETPQDYPNIRAMASGTISGAWREWPLVRGEAKALLAERDALRSKLFEAEVDRSKYRAEVVAWTDLAPVTADTLKSLIAERDTLRRRNDEQYETIKALQEEVEKGLVLIASVRCILDGGTK